MGFRPVVEPRQRLAKADLAGKRIFAWIAARIPRANGLTLTIGVHSSTGLDAIPLLPSRHFVRV